MLIGFIYTVTHNESGKVYVGKTVKPFDGRWKEHLSTAKHRRGSYFHNAIRKHGQDAFSWDVVDCAFSEEELDRKECEHIKRECSADRLFGYNSTIGGDGVLLNEVSRKKLSAALRKRWSDPAARQRMSALNRERCSDPAVRERMSAALSKLCEDPSERARRSARAKVQFADPAVRERMSAAMSAAERANRSATMRKLWSDPAARLRQSAVMKATLEKKFIASVAWG